MEIPELGESSQETVTVDNRMSIGDVPSPSETAGWFDDFSAFRRDIRAALPGSPFENGLNEYVNALWEQLSSEESPTPISQVLVPENFEAWFDDVRSYFKGLGPRLALPITYYSAQSLITGGYFTGEFKIGSNIELKTAVAALVGAHAINLLFEYLTFKSGGVPVNPLSPTLRRIIDKMPDKKRILHNKPLMATFIILNHSVFSEIFASGSIVVGSELYKSLVIANTLLLSVEITINGGFLIRGLGDNITDFWETLNSTGNLQFDL